MTDSITLFCLDRKKGKGKWLLEEHENGMNVFDPSDRLVFWFAHKDAGKHLALPSFWLEIKDIMLTTDKGNVIPFDPDPKKLRIVERYLDDAQLDGGLESLNGLKIRAICGLLAGIGIFLFCIAAAYVIGSLLGIPEEQSKWFARPFGFGSLAGIVLIGWSVYFFIRYRRLSRRYQDEQRSEAVRIDPD